MDTKKVVSFVQLIIFVGLVTDLCNAKSLDVNYYRKTCPEAESIVRKVTYKFISKIPTLAAPLLRMQFHDCFIRGCDGSVLLTSTKKDAERDAIPNQSLKGFHVIDAVKSALEKKCPGVVSCADIVALVARDAVSMIRGPFWEVTLGRRDGRVSNSLEALINLPAPFANITTLKHMFIARGLNTKDLVVLSGSHTIGTARCLGFSNRLYNFSGKGDTDPTMDPNYITHLKRKCKVGDMDSIAEMDPGSYKTFDDSYYKLVAKRRGLFQSDAALLDDKDTRAYVKYQAQASASGKSTFAADFAAAMVKMGQVGVLTGKNGEIRNQCGFVN